MNDLTPDRLAAIATRALERTAFMLADQVSFDRGTLDSAPRSAAIRYRGPSEGTVVLHTTDGFLRELSASIMGTESDSEDAARYAEDALKELANILGGSVILELGGQECSYTLGLPEIATPRHDAAIPDRTGSLDCEGHPLFVTWEPARAGSVLAA